MTNNTDKSKRLGETLRDGENLFLSLVDRMLDAMAIIDWDGTILFINKAGANLLGLASAGDCIGLNAFEFVHPDFRTLIINDLQLIKNGRRGSLADYRIYRLRTRAGEDKWIEAIGAMVYFGEDTADLVTFRDITARKQMEDELRQHRNYLEKLVAERTAELQRVNEKLQRDITERKRVERALSESREKYREFVESLPQIVFETDEKGNFILVNHQAFEIFGYTQEDIQKGLNVFQMIAPEERERAKDRIEKLLSGEELHAGEYIGLRKDGSTISILVHPQPIISDYRVVGMRGVVADVTELRKTQEALRDSESKYRDLVENLNDAIYSADLQGLITYVSHPIESLIGYNPSEIIGRSFTEFIYSEDLPRIQMQFEKIISDIIEPSEYRMVTKSGETRWVRSSSRAVYSGDCVIGIQGVITDITERIHAQDVMRESEEKFRSLASTTDSMYLVDRDCRFLIMNEGYLSRFGIPLEMILGRSYGEFHSVEDTKKFTKKVLDVFKSGSSIQHEHKSERDSRHFIRTFSPVKDRAGITTIAVTVVSKDITERKQAEEALRKREEELVNKSRMLEDINTTLRVLLKQREEDKAELEQKVSANIKELVIPYIEMLRKNQPDNRTVECLSILDSNLKNVVSPFSQKLSSKYFGLTPKEIQVASLIKEGRTSKEIAEILNVTTSSVDFHRCNIRNKFGLKSKKVSLRSYLLSFS
ncbi:MAG TPA: PAS domain S-box protein [Syntrophales bacterium]|nr:PAS domain S-box protein [Syntrophales bacterium]